MQAFLVEGNTIVFYIMNIMYRYKKKKEQSSNQTSNQGEEGEDKTEIDQ